MIGDGWWASGISVDYRDGEWSGTVDYFDHGWRNDRAKGGLISTEGQLRTRHRIEGDDALTAVIDALVADVERLGIRWAGIDSPPPMPTIYAAFEAAAGNYPDRYPVDWRDLLNAQARRLGWEPCYSRAAAKARAAADELTRLGQELNLPEGPMSEMSEISNDVIQRLTFECGHYRLSGPWDSTIEDGRLRHMIGDVSWCEVCLPVPVRGGVHQELRLRQVVNVEDVMAVAYREPDEDLSIARHQQSPHSS